MSASPNIECQQAIAALIKGTRSRKRPFSLIDVYNHLRTAIDCYGSVSAVAEHIGLSESMLIRFLAIEKLSKEMLSLVEARKLDSIDSVAEIGGLDQNRQAQLASCMKASKLSTEDVRNIVRMSRRFPQMSTNDILKTVEDARSKKVYSYEFIRRGSQTAQSIKEQLASIVSEADIVDIHIGQALGKVTLTGEGRSQVSRRAKSMSLTAPKLIERCITNSIS